jgi:glycosyltransferase involved in cell wall biosynthesis
VIACSRAKVSVITVCYNAESVIKMTIDSVLAQSSLNFEYIIIDGASTDGTYDIVEKYQQSFYDRGIRFTHISERDGGIYPAMNKAIQLCQGEWVIFMNAGDYFASASVLNDVFSSVIPEDTSVIYGKVVKFSDTESVVEAPHPITTITRSMPFCHQAAFVLHGDIKSKGFDTQFKIAADYDMFLGLYLAGKVFFYVDIVIAYFSLDGVSSKDNLRLYDDFLAVKHNKKIVDKNGFFAKSKRFYFIIKCRMRRMLGMSEL